MKLQNIWQCLNPINPKPQPKHRFRMPAQWPRWEDIALQALSMQGNNKERKPNCSIWIIKGKSIGMYHCWRNRVFRTVYKLINSKIKLVMSLEKKKSKKLLNSYRSMAMQPQLRNSRKSSRHLLKVLSDLQSRDTRKIWKKRGKQTRRLL